MSLLDTLDARLKPWAQRLFDVAKAAGVNPRITSAFRTYAQQEALYRSFIEGRSRYPAAKPGSSAHEYGLAFDMVVQGQVNQLDCGILWNRWRGDFGGEEDPIHFQFPGFSPPPGPRAHAANPAETVQTVPLYTPSTTLRKARRLADTIGPYVSELLGYSAGMAAIANAIAEIAGKDVPEAEGFLDWAIAHPEEFLDEWWDLMRSILLSYVL